MTILLTIHVDKWQYNRLYTWRNDYTIDYVHSQMTIQLTIHSQMTIQSTIYIDKWIIQLTMYIVKWLYNWLSTSSNDYTIDYIHNLVNIQLTIHVAKWLYNWLYT